MFQEVEIQRDSLQVVDKSEVFDLISLTIEPDYGLVLNISWYCLSFLIILIPIFIVFRRNLQSFFERLNVTGYKVKFSVPGIEFEKEIERSYQNVHISNRIYIELITRKAAMKINESEDVIIEIYDSWYSLFKTVRQEIKEIPGADLRNNKSTENLIEVTTKILNHGLRPHLTKYQAKFRKWYLEEIERDSSTGKSPQEIQQDFPEFEELIKDMNRVSQILINYSLQLKGFVAGR